MAGQKTLAATVIAAVQDADALATAADYAPPLEHFEGLYLTPYHDTRSIILALVAGARKSICVEIYGFALPALADALIAAHERGVNVRILFDHTQACGPSERGLVKRIADAGIEHYIGTSEQRHAIRHSKFMIVDGKWVEKGSLNYSESAFNQDNSVDIVLSELLATWLTGFLERSIKWLVANEPKYQIDAATAAGVRL